MSPQEVAAGRIRELREAHGWSQADLTGRLNQLGAGLDRSQVARVEQSGRGIPIDELILFAIALDTSLAALLFPHDGDSPVELTPADAEVAIEATAAEARAWARGDKPLWPFQSARTYVLSQPDGEQ